MLEIAEQLEDLVLRESIEQRLGHQRLGGLLDFVDIVSLDDGRLRDFRIDDHRDRILVLRRDNPSDDLAVDRDDDLHGELWIDLVRRINNLAEYAECVSFPTLEDIRQFGTDRSSLASEFMALGARRFFENASANLGTATAEVRCHFARKVLKRPILNEGSIVASGIGGLLRFFQPGIQIIDNDHDAIHPHPMARKGADVRVLARFGRSGKSQPRLLMRLDHVREV